MGPSPANCLDCCLALDSLPEASLKLESDKFSECVWDGERLACCTEAARRCIEGKDANLLPLVQFLFRDLDPAIVRLATSLHCIGPFFACQIDSFLL